MNRLSALVKGNWQAVLVYTVVALLLLWPLLGPGYILTLDMVFAPKLALPEVVTSSYLLHASLHILNLVIPSDVIQKLLLFAILALSGVGMHRLMRYLQSIIMPVTMSQWAMYASGLLYMINPFVYSRFMAGQYSVLLGYALLPFFVTSLLRFVRGPSLKTSLPLAAWALGISIVSIHTLGLALVIGVVALVQAIWLHRSESKYLKRLWGYVAATGVVLFIASSYWLLPLLQGSGPTASSIATFQASDQSAFATEGNSIVGKLIHVLRLQGFWGEREGLYLMPQEQFVLWPVVVIVVGVFIVIGARLLWRRNREIFALVMCSITIATLLAIGVGTAWLSEHIPFFAGYREPQKFVAIVALGYAIFFGFAVSKMIQKTPTKIGRVAAMVASMVIVIGFTPVMFGGFDGQLVPRQYPDDWHVVNEQLNRDHDTFEVLFLPWHLYMRYQFAGRVIAHPGNSFFDKPMLTSDDPEMIGTQPAIANDQKNLLTYQILPHASGSHTLGAQLRPLNIKYILLAKDADYASYDYLNHQKDLQLVSESATLKLYRNTAFRKDSE
jgi:hypothetical protein